MAPTSDDSESGKSSRKAPSPTSSATLQLPTGSDDAPDGKKDSGKLSSSGTSKSSSASSGLEKEIKRRERSGSRPVAQEKSPSDSETDHLANGTDGPVPLSASTSSSGHIKPTSSPLPIARKPESRRERMDSASFSTSPTMKILMSSGDFTADKTPVGLPAKPGLAQPAAVISAVAVEQQQKSQESTKDRKKREKSESKMQRKEAREARKEDKETGHVKKQEVQDRLRQREDAAATLTATENIVFQSGWCKVHTSAMKMGMWMNKWCCLKQGRFCYFAKEQKVGKVKDSNGTVIRLVDCEVVERATNKDGFAFDIVHVGGKRATVLTLLVFSEQERYNWLWGITEQIHCANMRSTTAQSTDTSTDAPPGFRPVPSFAAGVDTTRKPQTSAFLDISGIMPASLSGDDSAASDSKKSPSEILKNNAELTRAVGNALQSCAESTAAVASEVMIGEYDDLRKEIDLRLLGLERKVLTDLDNQSRAARKTEAASFFLRWWQLLVMVLLSFFFGHYFRHILAYSGALIGFSDVNASSPNPVEMVGTLEHGGLSGEL